MQMNRVNITRKGCFDPYKGKRIKIVDNDFKLVLDIDCYGNPKDKKMEYWTDAENESNIYYQYGDRFFSDVVTIFVLSDNEERDCKRIRF